MTCAKCDLIRKMRGQTHLVGKDCDICAGTRFNYLGDPCRHCNSANPLYKENNK